MLNSRICNRERNLTWNKGWPFCGSPRASPGHHYRSNFICPESRSSWYFIYRRITCSSMPTVETKYPVDHIPSFSLYILLNNLYLSRKILDVFAFIFPTTPDTAYFGGITIMIWIWSFCTFNSCISTPGIVFASLYNSFFKWSLRPGFKSLSRYFVIHTTWYCTRYTLWFDRRTCILIFYHKVSPSAFTPGQARGALFSVEMLPHPGKRGSSAWRCGGG